MEKQFKKTDIEEEQQLEPVNINGEIIYVAPDPLPRIVPKSGIDAGIEAVAMAVEIILHFAWKNRNPLFSFLGLGGAGYGVYILILLIPWAAVFLFAFKILGGFLIVYLVWSAFSNARQSVPFDDIARPGESLGEYIEEIQIKGRFKNINVNATTEKK